MSQPSAALTMAQQVGVRQTSPTTFISVSLPPRLGNGLPIAYGGFAAGIAVHSACKTVPSGKNLHVYSVLGAFHGPTRIDRPVNTTVTFTRNTKTFVTRRVVASQTQDDGTERTCLDMFVDFHILEPALLTYSATPARSYGNGPLDPVTTTKTLDIAQNLVKSKAITEAQAAAHADMFSVSRALWETRECVDGVSGQNLMGLAKHLRTTQDDLPMADKTSAEWLRLHEPLATEDENMAALAFVMDAALSFLPLNHDHKNFDDAGPCSTLDFALRILRPGIETDKWHMRERRTIGAAVARTYSESRLWDEQGNLVAVETQTCIARPLPGAGSRQAKL